ncbi:MAG: DUF2017 family protein [Actinomycetia bacterium]|nr:DUF2017 family protein [Actinomycetes bacterium]
MSWFNRKRVRRTSSGVSLDIGDDERDLLEHLIPQLRDLLVEVSPTGTVDDPVRRLFPTAHTDDPDLDIEYQLSSRDRLLASRLDRLDVVETTVRSDVLTFDQYNSWVAAINDVRLVLGTRLDVSEDDEPPNLDPEDPTAAANAMYHYLGFLLGELLDASEYG